MILGILIFNRKGEIRLQKIYNDNLLELLMMPAVTGTASINEPADENTTSHQSKLLQLVQKSAMDKYK